MTLPTISKPNQGLFVSRRLTAVAARSQLQVLRPQPWFPCYSKFELDPAIHSPTQLSVCSQRMFYIPRYLKHLDGFWMQRCIQRFLGQLGWDSWHNRIILDAHFGYPEGVACYREARRCQLPYFITLRGLEQEHFGTRIGDQIIKALNYATGVISVSHSLRNAAIQAGADPQNIIVIPNGIDHAKFHPKLGNSKSQTPLLVSIGNLKTIKGHDTLLRAFRQLRNKRDVRLVIIGGEDEPRHASLLRKWVTQQGLDEHVEFTGSLPEAEVVRWLQVADLFVLASRREGCCNVILEALACGVPVVATDVGDNSRYVHEGINGRLVAVDDERQLAEAIDSTLNESFDTEQVVNAVKVLTWERTAESVHQFFKSRLS